MDGADLFIAYDPTGDDETRQITFATPIPLNRMTLYCANESEACADVVSLPFFIWNAEGLARSLMFSATRNPDDHFSAPSVDALLGFRGIPAKIPMLLLLALTYALALFHRVPVFASLLLVMSAFFGFSSVLFRQYVVWFIPFIPLTVLEVRDRH